MTDLVMLSPSQSICERVSDYALCMIGAQRPAPEIAVRVATGIDMRNPVRTARAKMHKISKPRTEL